MRNISFMMTMEQVRRSFAMAAAVLKSGAARPVPLKDVTRRDGWDFLNVGDQLRACEKCQGLGPGGKIVRLGVIEVVSIRYEPLQRMLDNPIYGAEECRREGFPEMTPAEFVAFFCKGHKGVTPASIVTRIEFKYVEQEGRQP